MEKSRIIAAFCLLAAIFLLIFAAIAILWPPADQAIARDNAVNESLVGKNIRYLSIDQAMQNPRYRAMIQSGNPIIAPNVPYFAANLLPGSEIAVKISYNHFISGGNPCDIVFWGFNENDTLPLKFVETHEIPEWYKFKAWDQNNVFVSFDRFWNSFLLFCWALFFGAMGLLAWKGPSNGKCQCHRGGG